FADRNNGTSYVYQTSWGVSSRMIGALIMVHSDEDGLVLPPRIAPVQVRVIPIGKEEESKEVYDLADKLYADLNKENIQVEIDRTEKSPGFKFAEAEVLGIPVRIEVGKRDLENGLITLVRRDTKEKIQVSKDCNIAEEVTKLMDQIQKDMYDRALARREEMTYEVKTLEEFEKQMNTQPGFIRADWCGDNACEARIKEIRGCKPRCIMENEKFLTGKCVVCGKDAKHLVTWGIQY
ncbi:MAG: His/Gly/Thr/Pro-type tRNA ligase C-terminal domain-containing protein, partial [Clostridia bacterium]|nr:His/Gly/Thr/Pro-type tRNA ligase C-terminal domain-containing protein [Clostridia bacterium]